MHTAVWYVFAECKYTLVEAHKLISIKIQVISITVYSCLFVASSVMNLNVLANLLRAKRHVGLSRLNHLLLQLVLADLLVSDN